MICSAALVTKKPKMPHSGIYPVLAKPAAAVTILGSAIPNSNALSGKLSLKILPALDAVASAPKTINLSSTSPMSRKTCLTTSLSTRPSYFSKLTWLYKD